jgi:hypothetical protein
MTSCRLEHVPDLDLSHGIYIFIENLSDELFEFILLTKSQSHQTPTKEHVRHFMASSVVDSYI